MGEIWNDLKNMDLFAQRPEEKFNLAMETEGKRIRIPFISISLFVIVTLVLCGTLIFLMLLVETFKNKDNYSKDKEKNKWNYKWISMLSFLKL